MDVNDSFFADAFGIDDGWIVMSVVLDPDKKTSRIRVEPAKDGRFKCPMCGKECKVHDTYERTWRDLDLGLTVCVVHAKVPRTDCPEHGVKQISVPWAREYSRQTLNFERRCLEMIREMPVNAVARTMRISDDVLWNILGSYLSKAMDGVDMSRVRRIGIDETSCRKGHDYITLFVDMDTRKVLFAVHGRDSGTVKVFVSWLISHGGSPEKITDVSCDMGSPFLKGVSEELPKAKVTLDRFHVMKLANDALNTVRTDVQASKKKKLRIKYQLLSRRKNLCEKKAEELDIVLKENAMIGSAYVLKEMLGDMYLLEEKEHGKKYLDRWISFASAGVHNAVKKLARTISKHKEGILMWFDSKLSNGVLEGINSVIQGVKRMARGYRRPENMIAMLYLRGAGIVL
jgi:transposase